MLSYAAVKRFAFVMDPLKTLSLRWDTSLCLLRALAERGGETFLFLPEDVFNRSNEVKGKGRRIKPLGGNHYKTGPEKEFCLADFDAVFIRKDPPFDAQYLALTYLLEPLAKQTCVINDPRGIRNANEKLFTLAFSRWCPPTLVSANAEEILNFQRKLRSDLVIKPLYEKGGKGVLLLRRKRRGGFKTRPYITLQKATRSGKEFVVAQKFIPLPKEGGDKRILIWRGEILGAFLKIPRPGEFRSNLSLRGSSFLPCTVTAPEKKLVREMRPVLLGEGLFFVGIDVRAGRLIEVNVTSPAGLVELDELYGGASAKIAKSLPF